MTNFTYYTSFIFYVCAIISIKKYNIYNIIPLVLYFLFISSILHHSRPYANNNDIIKKFDITMVCLLTIVSLFYFYDWYCVWFSIIYTFIIYFFVLERFNEYNRILLHCSFHIVCGISIIYVLLSC